jgi:hypothetical protein
LQGLTDEDFAACCKDCYLSLYGTACKTWNIADFRFLLEKIGPQIFSEFIDEGFNIREKLSPQNLMLKGINVLTLDSEHLAKLFDI